MITAHEPKATWDWNTEKYFGRVEIRIDGQLKDYRMARVGRPDKHEAIVDAMHMAAKMDTMGSYCPINVNDYL